MASKQVTDRQKSADSVIAAGEANAELVQEAVARLVKPVLKKGEAAPDYAAVMRTACAALGAARDGMVSADRAHEAELGDDAGVRQARDTALAALKDELVGLREIVVGVYGPAAASHVFPGATPEDAVVLTRFAEHVADNLKKAKLPAPRIKGAKLDVEETIASLAKKREKLDGHLKDVQREIREAQATLEAKNGAVAAYDQVFGGVATVISGLLRLAGKPELAAKVRPSSRRPGQTAAEADDAPEPAAPPEK